MVDNTFSPMIISPAKWGADVVVHSMTKFISGASDIIAGGAALLLCIPEHVTGSAVVWYAVIADCELWQGQSAVGLISFVH